MKQKRDLTIMFKPMSKQIQVGDEVRNLSDIEIAFVQRELVGDQKSLGQIIREMETLFEEFYKSPGSMTRNDITMALQVIVDWYPKLLKKDGDTVHERLLTGHLRYFSGRKVEEDEVVVCFDWIFRTDEVLDIGPVAKLEALTLFRKLPEKVKEGIEVRFRAGWESIQDTEEEPDNSAVEGRYVVQRPAK